MVKNQLIWVSGCAQPSISVRAAIGTSHSSIPAISTWAVRRQLKMAWAGIGVASSMMAAPPG
ncbi:TPA: hypothetical protein ACRR39_001820 [Klebsiella quasipneumoniae]